MRKKLEVQQVPDEKGQLHWAIVVENEVFDWGVDEEDFLRAQKIIHNDPEMKQQFLANIQDHFVNSFAEFLGRPVTMEEINQALQQKWIDV